MKPDEIPLSLVIPARDEEKGLSIVLADLAKQPLPEGTEILVVDDGSRDRTADMAREAGARVLTLPGSGYGAALKAGFRAARGDWLSFMDADGTYPTATLLKLWECRSKASGMIIANRITKQNRMPFERKIANRFFNLIASLRLGRRIPDLCSGERLFPKRLLHEVLDLPDGLEFSPALTIRFLKRGHEVRWVDSPYHERVGISKLSILKDGPRFLKVILLHS